LGIRKKKKREDKAQEKEVRTWVNRRVYCEGRGSNVKNGEPKRTKGGGESLKG